MFLVLEIKNWKKTHKLDDLKKKCVDMGWSGFIAGNNNALFKNCGYDLAPKMMLKNPFNVPFYINLQKKKAEPAFGKWEFIAGKSITQP